MSETSSRADRLRAAFDQPRSRTPPRPHESAVAVSGQPPFPLGGKRNRREEPFRAADGTVYDSHGFALFPNVEGKAPGFDAHMEVLADLAMHEEWGGKDFNGNTHKFYLLQNYLKFSFMFIEAEQPDKRITSACGSWTAYDTRLVTKYEHGVEPIYALFRKNEEPNKWPWIFAGWCEWGTVRSPRLAMRAGALTTRPSAIRAAYAARLCPYVDGLRSQSSFEMNVQHIRRDPDQLKRIKAVAPDKPSAELAAFLSTAIDLAKKPTLNQRRVLPQLLRFKAVSLPAAAAHASPSHAKKNADLALTIMLKEKDDETLEYYATTVLTIGMAYNNARIFHSVENPWLRTIALDHDNLSS
ncbi:hypothetical protein JL722_1964 [Aureococcus anophagefferens]|nr:hypothetical protein JL722_1964 [Aureococcus anophagefferens]